MIRSVGVVWGIFSYSFQNSGPACGWSFKSASMFYLLQVFPCLISPSFCLQFPAPTDHYPLNSALIWISCDTGPSLRPTAYPNLTCQEPSLPVENLGTHRPAFLLTATIHRSRKDLPPFKTQISQPAKEATLQYNSPALEIIRLSSVTVDPASQKHPPCHILQLFISVFNEIRLSFKQPCLESACGSTFTLASRPLTAWLPPLKSQIHTLCFDFCSTS